MKRAKGVLNWFKLLGPGLISGAADDDPSGIGTYTQVGAQFRFKLLWADVLSLPCMIGIQDAAARIGRVTGRGLAANLKLLVPGWLLGVIVVLLMIANTINLGADLGAMGAALKLIVHGGTGFVFAAIFGLVSLIAPLYLRYRTYSRVLTWLCLSLFAYAGTAVVMHVPWGEALRATFSPSFFWDKDYYMDLAAILGTNVTPFLFFWQSGQEVEETEVSKERKPLLKNPSQAGTASRRITIDTVTGMVFNVIIEWFVALTAALVLHDKGIIDIESTTQAAAALKPVAGAWAEGLFAAGLIGTGLLTVPVLAGASGFALGETFGFKAGFRHAPGKAKVFYFVVALQIVAGLALNLFGVNPMKALVYAAIINSVVAVPIMVLTMLVGRSRKIMKQFTFPARTHVLGWFSTLMLAAATVMMVIAYIRGG